MKTRKNLVVAVLCTFCLAAVLFSAVPVNSAGTYDPWIDTNHDGRINVLDLIKVAGGLGTSGDATLNVNIANYPPTYTLQQTFEPINISWYSLDPVFVGTNQRYNIEGFSRMSVVISVVDTCDANFQTSLFWNYVIWEAIPGSKTIFTESVPYFPVTVSSSQTTFTASGSGLAQISTKAPYATIGFELHGQTTPTGWITFNAAVYLRNE
jgi:hypothetical protein